MGGELVTCANCKGSVDGLPYDVMGPTVAHRFASDCVRATAQRCVEISERGETSGQQLTGYGIAADIRKEFGLAPKPLWSAVQQEVPCTD